MAGNVRGTMREPVFQIEEVNDPVEVARCKAQDERGSATATGCKPTRACLTIGFCV